MQPSQFNKKKYQKVVRSHPMDMNRVVQPNDPMNQLQHNTVSDSLMNSTLHSMTGAKVVQHSIYDGTSQPIIDQMSTQ